ncbi:TPM domain-containing protein [Curvibacter sp. APW13]|uniref:TPM domain-containing protein n=1 Tax=Curvibacter sp. APW13 TaxID=3077236 RepID=UPI0028DE8BC9|nr:TPM domain-containing protein [Curvibacter sp. APW13]MDT8989435.1 TPM domain-containing protein [Curvibacter sp. APW13]
MWEQAKRLVKHALAPRWQHYLSEEAMQRITAATSAAEVGHSGEIRVCIEARLPRSYLLRRAPLPAITRQRAISQFSKLRVWDTEHNNGVLIYLLLSERRIELVADRGIDARVAAGTWQRIVQSLGQALRQDDYEQGLLQAVAAVSTQLQTHFATADSQPNPDELPNRPDAR